MQGDLRILGLHERGNSQGIYLRMTGRRRYRKAPGLRGDGTYLWSSLDELGRAPGHGQECLQNASEVQLKREISMPYI